MLPDFLIPFVIVAIPLAILGLYAKYRASRDRSA